MRDSSFVPSSDVCFGSDPTRLTLIIHRLGALLAAEARSCKVDVLPQHTVQRDLVQRPAATAHTCYLLDVELSCYVEEEFFRKLGQREYRMQPCRRFQLHARFPWLRRVRDWLFLQVHLHTWCAFTRRCTGQPTGKTCGEGWPRHFGRCKHSSRGVLARQVRAKATWPGESESVHLSALVCLGVQVEDWICMPSLELPDGKPYINARSVNLRLGIWNSYLLEEPCTQNKLTGLSTHATPHSSRSLPQACGQLAGASLSLLRQCRLRIP